MSIQSKLREQFGEKSGNPQAVNAAQSSVWAAACTALLAMGVLLPGAQAQAVPSANVFQNSTLVNINGNAGHVAANSFGDAFYVSQTDNVAYWLKHGTTTPIPLVTGLSGGRSVYVDSSNNVFVPSNYSGVVIEVPFVNNTYITGSARTSLAACTSNTPTTPCTQFGNGGGGVAYYYQATDLALDSSGNAYIVDAYDNESPNGIGKSNAIEVFKYNGVSYAATVLIQSLPNTTNAQIAVDAAGDIFYADGTNLYTAAAGSTAVSAFGSNFKAPSGVSIDKLGNLYVTDSTLDEVFEFPGLNGVPQTGTQLVFDPVYSANGVAVDNLGDMYYTGYSGGATNLNIANINGIPLGTAAVGKAVSATGSSLTVVFNSSQTLAAPVAAGVASGFVYTAGSCAAGTAYTAGQSCTVTESYTPTAVGLQKGAVTFTNASGATIATAELSGIGAGAAQTSDPGTANTIGSGYTAPSGIAVDAAKNVYIANTGKNTVVEYPLGSTTAVSLGTGLSGPTSVALDGGGNLYIADSGNGRVVEVPAVAGVLTSSAQKVIVSGLGSALGIATDLFGNLYVADSTHNKVYRLGVLSGVPSSSLMTTMTLPSTSVAPLALATDNAGDLFIADVTANTITEISYYGKLITNIGSGYSHPSGLAVDAAGSLYVADPGNVRLIKIPFESPIYNTNDQYSVGPPFTIATGVTIPYGVAIDSTANLYVVDNADATAIFLNRQQGTLNLGNSNVGQTTAQQNAYIADAGTQSLVLGNPDYTAAAVPSFTITSPATGGCTNSETILPGFSCVLQAIFKPAAVGSFSETLAFNDNAANTTSPSLTVSGTGLNVAATTLTLAQTSPTGTAAFGQKVVVTATISSTTMGTPTNDIIVYIDGNFFGVVKVTGTANPITITGLLGGSHTIAASYTGDNTFASSNATLILVVAQAGNTVGVVATGPTLSQYPTSAGLGSLVTLTATVTPSSTTAPTGTVTFTSGSLTLGSASVSPSGSTYQAAVTTTKLPFGNDTVVASYSGDINYAPTQGTVVILISPQTFSISPTTVSATVGIAGNVSVPFSVNSIAGFGNAYVSMTCAGLPANTSCGFDPNGFVLQPGNLLTAQLTNLAGTVVLVPATYGPSLLNLIISTGTTPVVAPPPVTGLLRLPGEGAGVAWACLLFAPLALLAGRKSRRRLGSSLRLLAVLLLMAVTVTGFSGCGSNVVGVTPPGTYNVTITATATDSSYPTVTTATPLATGCSVTPSTSTLVTCVQQVQLTLVVHQ